MIDLILNLSFFVYWGSIIPWEYYNFTSIGITPWRLVVLAILVLILRRLPAVLAFKPVTPDIKTWREAIFCGHFGPIGVGAIFTAMLARAELETEGAVPLATLPKPGEPHYLVIMALWPIVSFLVLASILVHGSSIAVYMLGKRIHPLSMTLTFTQTQDVEGPSWLQRLPRLEISATSQRKRDTFDRRQATLEKSNGSLDVPSGGEAPRLGGPVNPAAIGPVMQPPERAHLAHSSSDVAGTAGAATPQDHERPTEHRESTNEPRPRRVHHIRRGRRSRNKHHQEFQEGDKIIIEDENGEVVQIRNVDAESRLAARPIYEDHTLARKVWSYLRGKPKHHSEVYDVEKGDAEVPEIVIDQDGHSGSTGSSGNDAARGDGRAAAAAIRTDRKAADKINNADDDVADDGTQAAAMKLVDPARAQREIEEREEETEVERRRRLAALGLPESEDADNNSPPREGIVLPAEVLRNDSDDDDDDDDHGNDDNDDDNETAVQESEGDDAEETGTSGAPGSRLHRSSFVRVIEPTDAHKSRQESSTTADSRRLVPTSIRFSSAVPEALRDDDYHHHRRQRSHSRRRS